MSAGSNTSADSTKIPLVIDDEIIFLDHVVHVELQYEDMKKAHLNFPPSVRITFGGGHAIEFSGDRANRLRNWFKGQGNAIVL